MLNWETSGPFVEEPNANSITVTIYSSELTLGRVIIFHATSAPKKCSFLANAAPLKMPQNLTTRVPVSDVM